MERVIAASGWEIFLELWQLPLCLEGISVGYEKIRSYRRPKQPPSPQQWHGYADAWIVSFKYYIPLRPSISDQLLWWSLMLIADMPARVAVGRTHSNLFRGVSCMDQCKAQKNLNVATARFGCVLGIAWWCPPPVRWQEWEDWWGNCKFVVIQSRDRQERTLVDKHPSHTLDRAAYGQRYLLLDAFGCKTLGVLAILSSYHIDSLI